MNEKTFESFKKIVAYDCDKARREYVKIQADHANDAGEKELAENIENLDGNCFFEHFYENGFLCGILWSRKHGNTKFVFGEEE